MRLLQNDYFDIVLYMWFRSLWLLAGVGAWGGMGGGILVDGFRLPDHWTPLQNLLSGRAVSTAVSRRLSYEFLDTTHILGAVSLFQQNHHFDILFFGCCTLSMAYLLSPRTYSTTSKLSRWPSYSQIERRVNQFILIAMIIMNKNIEVAT